MLFDIMEQHFKRNVGRPVGGVKGFGEVKSREACEQVSVALARGSRAMLAAEPWPLGGDRASQAQRRS